jgi:hypothetical protein
MATPRMDITSFVGKLLEQDDVDALREGVRVLAQAVMEIEVFNTRLKGEDLYNFHRPHGALGGQTPYERLREKTRART